MLRFFSKAKAHGDGSPHSVLRTVRVCMIIPSRGHGGRRTSITSHRAGKSTSPRPGEFHGGAKSRTRLSKFPFHFHFLPPSTSFSEGSLSIPEPPHVLSHSVMSDPCDPMDCSPPGSSVHGISQARILEWLAISSSRKPLDNHSKLTMSWKDVVISWPQGREPGGDSDLAGNRFRSHKIPELSVPRVSEDKLSIEIKYLHSSRHRMMAWEEEFHHDAFLRSFWCGPFLKSLLNLSQYCLFYVLVFLAWRYMRS